MHNFCNCLEHWKSDYAIFIATRLHQKWRCYKQMSLQLDSVLAKSIFIKSELY